MKGKQRDRYPFMPASQTADGAQRTIQARRTRLRRGGPGSAIAEGSRSSGDSKGNSEESEATAGLTSNNRFAVLHPKEPAPGVLEKRESTLPLDPSFRRERPITLPFRTNIISTDQPSSSKDESLAPTSSPIPGSKKTSRPRLSRTSPSSSASIESKQQPSTPAAASASRTKPLAQPPPLVLQLGAQAAQFPKLSLPPNLIPVGDTIAATHLSILPQDAAPSLPSPPIPPDPMAIPSLATLPIPPSFDFKDLTSPQSCEPVNCQFAPPKPTRCDIFGEDDSAHHIVKTTRGRIFWMAAEIAAANERSKMKPVGNFFISKPAQKAGKVKGKIDRKKLNRECGEYVGSREATEDKSEEEGEGEEWLGKEERFWKQPFEEGDVVRTRTQTSKEESR